MFEGFKINSLRKKMELRELEQLNKTIIGLDESDIRSRSKQALEDEDESSWALLGGESAKRLDEQDQANLRCQAQKYYYRNPHARQIIRLFEMYITGRGFQVIPKSQLPEVQEYWNQFWEINSMDRRKKEITRRVFRDGEVFIRYFYKDDMTTLRFLNPEFVKNPDNKEVENNTTFGIETDKDDIEEVKKYWYRGTDIDAKEILHDKIMVDSDVKRGRSYLEAIAPLLAMYQRWLQDRMKLNMVRATVALIKKVSGTPAQAGATVSQYKTTKNKAPDNTSYHRAPEGVSVFTVNKGVDYDLKSPNLQASDVQHDGRAILLSIAAGSGLPEFMVSSDASNSNYASAMIAEGPAVQNFKDWQDHFAFVFKQIYRKVIENAIQKNKIPSKETIEDQKVMMDDNGIEQTSIDKKVIDTSTECDIVFPELIHRDLKDETEALILQKLQGWISDSTAAGRLDLDFEEEREKQKKIDIEDGMSTDKDDDEKALKKARDDEFKKARDDEMDGGAIDKEKEPKTE